MYCKGTDMYMYSMCITQARLKTYMCAYYKVILSIKVTKFTKITSKYILDRSVTLMLLQR